MVKLYFFTIICLAIYIFAHSRWFRRIQQAWQDSWFYAKKPKLTMFDVRQLLIKGEKDLAIKVYCELFKTNPEEARKAVEEIERSIQPKDFEF